MASTRGKKVKTNQVTVREDENTQKYVAPFLQQEIISEILSYLPVDSLLRCKSVCKLWCTIIREPKFIRNHLARTKPVNFYGDNCDFSGDEEFIWVSCLHGLVLENSRSTNKYRIRNPATRQVLYLPDPDGPVMLMSLFYVPIMMEYKLLSFNREQGSSRVGCQILTFADNLTWRSLSIPSLENLFSNNARVFPRNNSDTYYFVKIVEELGDSEIIWIDAEKECFSSLRIPRVFFTNWRNVQLMTCDKKLSLATIVEEVLHVWVSEDFKKNKWAERKIVPLKFMKDFPRVCERPFEMTILGSLLYIDGNRQPLVYDIDCKKVVRSPIPLGRKILGHLRSTAVHLKGMQPQQSNGRSG